MSREKYGTETSIWEWGNPVNINICCIFDDVLKTQHTIPT